MSINYLTGWFVPKISGHGDVASAIRASSSLVQVERKNGTVVTIAPVSTPTLTETHVDEILGQGDATIICLVPKASHYLWSARTRAQDLGSDVQTMSEVFWAMGEEDVQGFLSKNVSYARRALGQHARVQQVQMICEASMRLVRHGGMPDIRVSVDYGYEFGEEALMQALERHPEVEVVLNSNPNGRFTSAALRHAENAGVRIFDMSSLMGALNNP
ncbi:hypothetical protein J3A78_002303 [Streptomyces sp. PvR006]|uniref:hypothetical protein n=1 Tax=Streptomyces sp. PvR006 TaxID=2817860 RepID=UPI001AE6CF63|nr:hypothetical protein [Streptomyces sp. PvR006]MBP2581825.1 hypothetical protein [Streptomyces sp. PvR006]